MANPKVFGTFGVEFDPSEIESMNNRTNCYDVNLVPDCRVFIFGVDVTKDVVSVDTSSSLNNIGRCSISLANPRGKYVISKDDLRKKWREDKDILDAYTLKQFEKQFPKDFVSKALSLAGASIESTFDYFKKTYAAQTLNVISTRMIFETKFYSGNIIKAGETVFGYRDPVLVFFKGRFSPFWYFGFSGVITGIDDSNTYGESSNINLECHDILHLWDKQHLMARSSMLPAGRYELRRVNTKNTAISKNIGDGSSDREFNISNIGSLSFNKFIQFCGFGWSDLYSIHNNNLILNNIDKSKAAADLDSEKMVNTLGDSVKFTVENDNTIDYFLWNWAQSSEQRGGKSDLISLRERIREIFAKCNMSKKDFSDKDYMYLNYMFSQRPFAQGKSPALIPHPGGLINGHKDFTDKGPNSQRLSSWNLTYLQYIKIAPKVLKTQNEIPKWYEATLRFWEKNPTIPQTAEEVGDSVTGWKDNDYFCVAGSHPAMTYTFLNNFNILPHIYREVVRSNDNSSGFKPLDKLVVSPEDKIRELIVGSPTEYDVGNKNNVNSTHANFFRPRLFFLAPRRYNTEKSAQASDFVDLSLTETNTISCWGIIQDLCKNLDYNIYASPMGDIFIEPEMYDMHPKLFMEPTQYKNYYCDATSIPDPAVAYKNPSSTDYTKVSVDKKNTSWFGERSVHPLTVMSKDIFRDTKTFQASQMATSVKITAAMTDIGETSLTALFSPIGASAIESAYQKSGTQLFPQMNIMANSFGLKIEDFRTHVYIADGFRETYSQDMGLTVDIDIPVAEHALKKTIAYSIVETSFGATTWYAYTKKIESTYYDLSYSTSKEYDKNKNYIYTRIAKDYRNIKDKKNVPLSDQDKKTLELCDFVNKTVHETRKKYISTYGGYLEKISAAEKELQELRTQRESIVSNTSGLDTKALSLELSTVDAKISGKISQIDNYKIDEAKLWRDFNKVLNKDNPKNTSEKVEELYYMELSNLLYKELTKGLYTDYFEIGIKKSKKPSVSFIVKKKIEGASKFSTLKNIFVDLDTKDGSSFYSKLLSSSDDGAMLKSFEQKSSIPSSIYHKALYTDMVTLFRDVLICEDVQIQKQYDTLRALYDIKLGDTGLTSNKSPRTLGDLKQLAIAGKYNAKRDLMRIYGYNPAPPKTFLYVKQKGAAQHYAMMYFNKFIGQANYIQSDIPGRPELQLNRPTYFATRDSIGLLTSHNIKYNNGSAFNSHISLSHIRHNSLMYAYTLGQELDGLPYIDGEDQNLKFKQRADAYYEFLAKLKAGSNIMSALNSAAGNVVPDAFMKKGTSLLSDALSSNEMGLHSFHDEIGQLDLDKRMTEEEDKRDSKTISMPTGVDPYDTPNFRKSIQLIQEKLDERQTIFSKYESAHNTIKNLENLIEIQQKTLGDISLATVPEGIKAAYYSKDNIYLTEDTPLKVENKYELFTTEHRNATITIGVPSYNTWLMSDPFLKNVQPNTVHNFALELSLAELTKSGKLYANLALIQIKMKACNTKTVKDFKDAISDAVKAAADYYLIDLEVEFDIAEVVKNDGSKEDAFRGFKVICNAKDGSKIYKFIAPITSLENVCLNKDDQKRALYALGENRVLKETPYGGKDSTSYNSMLVSFDNNNIRRTYLDTVQPKYSLDVKENISGVVTEYTLNMDYTKNVKGESILVKDVTLSINCGQKSKVKDVLDIINSFTSTDFPFRCVCYNGLICLCATDNTISDVVLKTVNNKFIFSNNFTSIPLQDLRDTDKNKELIVKELRRSCNDTLKRYSDLRFSEYTKLKNYEDQLLLISGELFGSSEYNLVDAKYRGASNRSEDDLAGMLSKWTVDYFEAANTPSNVSNLLRHQKLSLFGKLLLDAYAISGSKNWKLDFNARQGTGHFNKNPIKFYVKTTLSVPKSEFVEYKRFTWKSDLNNSSAPADTLNFNLGRPDNGDMQYHISGTKAGTKSLYTITLLQDSDILLTREACKIYVSDLVKDRLKEGPVSFTERNGKLYYKLVLPQYDSKGERVDSGDYPKRTKLVFDEKYKNAVDTYVTNYRAYNYKVDESMLKDSEYLNHLLYKLDMIDRVEKDYKLIDTASTQSEYIETTVKHPLTGQTIVAEVDMFRLQAGGDSFSQLLSEKARDFNLLFKKVFIPPSGIKADDYYKYFMNKIKEVIDEYHKNPNSVVKVMGFTCTSGDADYNEELSQRRSQIIYALLSYGYEKDETATRSQDGKPTTVTYKKMVGIPRGYISWTSVGERTDYLQDAKTKGGKVEANRRVEIYITPNNSMKVSDKYTVWEDWNTPVTVKSINSLTKEYDKELEGY